jgi:biopolymer transport protein TolQ
MINYVYAADKVQVNTDMWHAILSANIIVQASLLTLVVMSITTWAIVFMKRSHFNRIKEANAVFLDEFWKASSLDDVHARLAEHKDSPAALVFHSGYAELRKIADSNLADKGDGSTAPLLSGIDNLERALHKATDIELSKVEKRLTFLASTGSSGPFIGLFGTVIGIMTAFNKIAQAGSANLAVVAPGISEALIATAVGLFAAIPASVFYNVYMSKIGKLELELNNFSNDFLNIAKRNFFRED